MFAFQPSADVRFIRDRPERLRAAPPGSHTGGAGAVVQLAERKGGANECVFAYGYVYKPREHHYHLVKCSDGIHVFVCMC